MHLSSGYLSLVCVSCFMKRGRGTKLAVLRVRIMCVSCLLWRAESQSKACILWRICALFEMILKRSQESLQMNLVLLHNSMSHAVRWQSRPTEVKSVHYTSLNNPNRINLHLSTPAKHANKHKKHSAFTTGIEMSSLKPTAHWQWGIIGNLSSETRNCKFSFLIHWQWNETYWHYIPWVICWR